MRWGDFDFSSFEELNRRIDTAVNDELLKKTAHKIINTAGNQAFRGVKMRTPRARNSMLIRSWKRSEVQYHGNNLIVTISNNAEYASFVENGHRQQPGRFIPGFWLDRNFIYDPEAKTGMVLKARWVEGVHMLRDSMAEAERSLPLIADKECKKALKQILNNE